MQKEKAATALHVGLAHFALSLLIQVESLVLYAHLPSKILPLALFQREHVLVAALLAAVSYFLQGGRAARYACFALAVAMNLYLVLNQVLYRLFFDHFHPGLGEGRVERLDFLLSSFAAEIDLCFLVNLVVWAALAAFLFLAIVRGRFTRPPPWPVLALVMLGAVDMRTADFRNLDHHPLARALTASSGTGAAPNDVTRLDPGVYRPRAAAPAEPAGERHAIAGAFQRFEGKTPNVVLIVLESVGSDQLLTDGGLPSARVTPFLRELADRSVLFPSVYVAFPGTTRSHVALATGGPVVTWESVYGTLEKSYQGPTLLGELKRRGYAAGLFTAADIEGDNMESFYKELGFDRLMHFGVMTAEFQDRHRLSGWGGDEDSMRHEAVRWIESVRSQGKPFFLELVTVSTHHPYVAPPGYRGPFPGKDSRERYLNALHYSDAVLRRFVADLAERGLAESTMLVLTGDHGQAFGENHKENFVHRNFLYEENIKSFLMIARPGVTTTGPVISRRIGASADVMPTVLSLLGDRAPDVPGQSLLSPAFRPRMAFFHKSTEPAQWGLRDGKWKFISRVADDSAAELYDLESDGGETRNLASAQPDLVRQYREACPSWYFGMNAELTRFLRGYVPVGGSALTAADLREVGPRRIAFGYADDDGHFTPLGKVSPYEHVTAKTVWMSFPKDKEIRYEWTSPSGRVFDYRFLVKAEWSTTSNPHPAPLPLETGRWSLTLWDGERKLMGESFAVDSRVPPMVPSNALPWASTMPGPKRLFFGYEDELGDFARLDRIHPLEKVQARARWYEYEKDTVIAYDWISPSGKRHAYDFVVKKGWTRTTNPLGAPAPLEEGTWRLVLREQGRRLASGTFVVDASAPLHAQATRSLAEAVPGGPRSMQIGFKDLNEDFVEAAVVHPRLHVTLRTQWRSYDTDRAIRWDWVSPSGKRYGYLFTVRAGWTRTHNPLEAPLPLERGRWKVTLYDAETELLSTEFLVGESGPLEVSMGFPRRD